ncbi:hypothetical protein LX32DRAFT_639000 [Colletotrichum zoysiae]|uniref:Uncharacterized protein n=1 Tax=Colletotrichum zoysiae TaxID=1216348 RepID=A0AAD9HID6_9PEZI|nr:hypothetical protein LX32DRAFT_639000 [Colletotrichum zoysiae]
MYIVGRLFCLHTCLFPLGCCGKGLLILVVFSLGVQYFACIRISGADEEWHVRFILTICNPVPRRRYIRAIV